MKDTAIYQKCYFRIESRYKWGSGMDEEQNKLFEEEIKKIFIPLGFTVKAPEISHASIEVWRGAENLYCHPMDLVGYIININIPKITEELQKTHTTFTFRCVDTYDLAFNYTMEELKVELESNQAVTKQDILNLFRTKRKNLFKSSKPLWDYNTGILFFRNNIELKELERNFINSIFIELCKNKLIEESSNSKVGKIYRTIGVVSKERNMS